ncbi:MAG: cytochrome c [Bryobacteraceae bacterium]
MSLLRLSLAVCIAATPFLLASEDPTPEHVKMMKDVNDTNGKIRKGVDVEANAKHLAELAKQVEAIWSKKSEVAGKSSANLVAGTESLVKAAAANDTAAMQAAGRVIGGSCRSCHDAHREKISETEYKIK